MGWCMMYRVILADPAWHFKSWSQKGNGRSAAQHYQTLSVDDICALPVGQVAADNSVLFLWAIDSMLPEAIRVGQAWGFTYKTVAFTWVKQVNSRTEPNFIPTSADYHWHMGMGYWTRANPEMCLLFTCGKPKRIAKGIRQLVVAPVRKHSQKPDAIYTRIESLVQGRYLELFARKKRPNWTSLGNEIDGVDLATSLLNLKYEEKQR